MLNIPALCRLVPHHHPPASTLCSFTLVFYHVVPSAREPYLHIRWTRHTSWSIRVRFFPSATSIVPKVPP